jgi:hypothetical protein
MGTSSPKTRTDDGLVTLRYEETTPAKPPIPVTVAPPRKPPTDTHPALRGEMGDSEAGLGNKEVEERKRDSGLAPTTSSKAREGSLNTGEAKEKEEGVLGGFKVEFESSIPASVPATPKIQNSVSVTSSGGSFSRWRKPGSRKGSLPKTPPSAKMESPSEEEFSPITTPIPTDSLLDAEFLDTLSFSKRGSMMLGGKKAVNGHARQKIGRRQPSFSMLASPSIKILSDDLDEESRKVRSMYEAGFDFDWNDGRFSSMEDRLNVEQETTVETPESYVTSPRFWNYELTKQG